MKFSSNRWHNNSSVYNNSNDSFINRSAVSVSYRQCSNQADATREKAASRASSASVLEGSSNPAPSPSIFPIH